MGCAGKRRGAERRFVQALAAVPEARAVAPEHLDIGKEVMTEGDGLRRLQVREARHDGGGIFFGAIDQRVERYLRAVRFARIETHRLAEWIEDVSDPMIAVVGWK